MARKHSRNNKASAGSQSDKSQNKLNSTLIGSTLLVLTVAIVALVYLALIDRPAITASSVEAQSQSLAEGQSAVLDQALKQLQLRLDSLAGSPQFLAALEANDQAEIDNCRREFKRAFPEAQSSQLIPLGAMGIAALKPGNNALRNNIEQDLVRAISNGEAVEPEAYRYQNKWLFSLAAPIQLADKSYASGALLVSLGEQYLLDLLGQSDSRLGKTELIQQFSNKQHLIASVGQNIARDDLAVTADTAVTHWQIRFTPSAELVERNTHDALLIWITLAVIAVAVLLAGWYAWSSLSNALRDNLKQLQQPKNADAVFSLPGFADVAAHLTNRPEPSPAAKPAPAEKAKAKAEKPAPMQVDEGPVLPDSLPENIFRAYDIRGIADTELSDDIVYAIGLAIGSEALDQGQQTVVVAADGRHSSPRIQQAMVKGLRASGRDVIDIGTQPTPLMYFATHQLGAQSGVMITGSHNPSEYNGIKIVIAGRALSGAAIQGLKQRILDKKMSLGSGQYQSEDIQQSYIDYIVNDVAIAQPLKVVVDAGNGVTGGIAPQLFADIGCEVVPLYCEVDGNFPNHHPDPSVEANLADLKVAVAEHEADLGLAFDGDGDRVGVVTATGQSVAADRLLMLLAQDVVSRNPGADVLFDVKCTRNLNSLISNYGGRPIMWKTGHSFMKEKMQETGALLGGEYSGHIFFKERWFGFDDGLYAGVRLIEILSTTDPDLDLQLSTFPESISSPELKVETTDTQKFAIIDQLVNSADFADGKVSTLDGLRVDFSDGWGLVRASNTTPMLILRFEADTDAALSRIQQQFKQQLAAIDNSLQFSF